MFDFEGLVKRADLNLKLKYLGLDTKIYKINNSKYEIYCKNIYFDFLTARNEFNSQIRTIGTPVDLISEKPEKYEIIIEGININDVTSNFEGIAITMANIEDLLFSKFHYIDFHRIYENPNTRGELIIEVFDTVTLQQENEIKEFLKKIKLVFDNYVIKKISGKIIDSKKSSELILDPMSCCIDKDFEFSIRDSQLWFDNVQKIYTGEFIKEDLYFYDDNKTKCFLDLSLFDNINLRNNILLYDTVYCSLPLASKFDEFLEIQNITREELLELAYKGRIKFLLPNTEKRYNVDFIRELYKVNSDSIITKRGINLLIACYLTEISDRYIFNNIDDLKALSIASEALERENRVKAKNIFSLLTWPIQAKIESFRILNFSSPLGISSFGANTIMDEFIDKLDSKKDIEFELLINSPNIHISSALDATYFPFHDKDGRYSDAGVANILGNLLNFYKYSHEDEFNLINDIRKFNIKEQNIINLLQIKKPISILKYDEYSKEYNTRSKLKNILLNLEKMSSEERKLKISEYNKILLEVAEHSSDKKVDIINYILSIGGFVPYVGTGFSALGLLKSIFTDLRNDERKTILKLIDKVSEKKYSKEEKDNVYILSKIDRIASLKF